MTQVVPSAAVMRIAPQMTDSAIRARLELEAIDGVLIVERGGVGFKMTRDRPEMTCSSGTPWQCYPTSPSAQHVEWHPDRLTFRTTLWDARTLRVIWVGRTDVYQNGAPEAPYLPVLAQEVLRSLDRQRLLLPRSPTD